MVPEISPITGQPRSVVIITTIAGATIAFSLALWATQRSTSAGFRTLIAGMRAIENGKVGRQVAIETDDELGRLAEGFNALSRELEASHSATVRAEAERAQAARQFHEAQKRDALGRLAAGIAHDFNNILAIIVMYSDTVRTRLPEDDANRKRLQEVLTAANRGKDLISQILDFTRDKAVEHERVDLAANLQETIGLLQGTVARDRIINLKMPPDAIWVDADATGLHQIVANLAINAFHAMPDSSGILAVDLGTVEVDAHRAALTRDQLSRAKGSAFFERVSDETSTALLGELSAQRYARITIADNGTGMSLDTLRRVFDPYFTTKPVGEGTGLGLAAVAGLAAAHGGAIDVETTVDNGTCFHIYIPLCEKSEELQDDG